MEKHTLSHYGWIVILILILCLLISLATPFGGFVKDSALAATRSFVGLTYDTLGLEKPLSDGGKYFIVDNLGVLFAKPLYASTSLKESREYIENELKLSKNAAEEYLAYTAFSGDNPSSEEWRELGISKSDLKLLAQNFVLDEIDYDAAAVTEMTNNPNCTTFEQAALNCVYDFSENALNETNTRASTQNITEEELNQLWRLQAAAIREELLESLNAVSDNTEVALNILIAKEIGLDDIVLPEDESKITREFVYEANRSILQPKLQLDMMYAMADAILYNTDSLSYQDVIGLEEPLFYIFSIEDFVNMANNKGADIDKASMLALDGFTVSEYIDLIYDGGTLPSSFEIPEEINGVRVTQITQDTGFRNNDYIYEIRLPESLYKISSHSFKGCENLSNINLNNVSVLEAYAFESCESLKKIELSKSLETIPTSCFSYCRSLKEVIINDGTKTISDYAFYDCSALEKVIIPSSVTSISSNAFYNCSQKLIIYGVPGSAAETYAKNNNYTFKAL